MAAVLVLVGLALAALLAVRGRQGLTPGPLFWHELRRAAFRRGTFARRAAVAGGVLLAVGLAYVLAAPGIEPDPNVLLAGGRLDAAKARWVPLGLAFAAVMIQLAAVGGRKNRVTQEAVLEERERRTLPFLLVSDLSDREIVFGRPVARLAAGLLTGLAVLPLVAWLLGLGVDVRLFLVAYGLLGTLALSTHALMLCAAVRSANPAQAQRRGGMAVALLFVLPMPLAALTRIPALAGWPGPPPWTLNNLIDVLVAGNPMVLMMRAQFLLFGGGPVDDLLWDTLPGWVAFHLVLMTLAGLLAVRSLRPYSATFMDGPPPRRTGLARLRRRPMGDRPVFWKAVYLDHPPFRRPVERLVSLVTVAAMMLPLAVPVLLARSGLPPGDVNVPVRILCFIGAALTLAYVATLASQSLIRERRKNTLDDLLLTDLTAREILGQKLAAALWGARWVLPGLAAYLVVGVLTGGLHALAPAAFAAVLGVQALFAAAAGAYLASRCTTAKDIQWPGTALGLAVALPPVLLALPLFWDFASPRWQGLALFGAGASPGGLWLTLFCVDDFRLGTGPVTSAMAGCEVGLVVYSLWAWRLWRAALRRFPEAVGRRG